MAFWVHLKVSVGALHSRNALLTGWASSCREISFA